MAVERIGDAAHVPTDAEDSCVEIDGLGIADLRDAHAAEIETLVVRAGVLVVDADDVASAPVPERPRCRAAAGCRGPKRYQEKSPLKS
jgi:hypothetical protein